MLMDYAIECDNIIYYHHMIALLGFLGLVAGIFLWVKCSMVDFIERLDEVGLLSCLARVLENRVDFCSHFRLLWFSLAIERFSY